MLLNDFIATRDPKILDRVYHQYVGRLRKFFRRKLNDTDTDDCVQDLFFTLLEYKGPVVENEEAFLMHNARHVRGKFIRDERYAGRREVGDNATMDECEFERFTGGLDSIPRTCDPLKALLDQEAFEIIDEAVSLLPEHVKHCMERVFWGGDSYAQIAEDTGTNYKTLCSRVEQGMRDVKIHLQYKRGQFYEAIAV